MAVQPPAQEDQIEEVKAQVLAGLEVLASAPGADEGQIQQCIELVSNIGGMPGGEEAMLGDGGELGAAPAGYSGGSFDDATAAVKQFEQSTGGLPTTEELPPEEEEENPRRRLGQGQ